MEEKGEYLSDSEAQILLFTEESPESSESEEARQLRSRFKDSALIDGTNSWPSVHSKKPLLKVYRRRWLILGIFSLLSFMQVSLLLCQNA